MSNVRFPRDNYELRASHPISSIGLFDHRKNPDMTLHRKSTNLKDISHPGLPFFRYVADQRVGNRQSRTVRMMQVIESSGVKRIWQCCQAGENPHGYDCFDCSRQRRQSLCSQRMADGNVPLNGKCADC